MDNTSGEKKKAKHHYSTAEAADYLRRLADQLESGSIQLSSEEMEFEGEVKVKESLKSKAGRSRIKVQFKVSLHEHEDDGEPAPGDTSAEAPATAPKPAPKPTPKPKPEPKAQEPAPQEPRPKPSGRPSSFKDLKKQMSSGFKDIRRSLQDGQAPVLDTARAFYDDCLLMITFSGNGDPDYPSFQAKAEAFWAAAQAGDLEGINQAFDQLKAAKSSCHKQYK